MTLEQDLQRLGFKENDAKVYVAVLALGEPTIGDLEKETGLHKQLIYLSADRLQKEGLLSVYEIRRRKRFSVPNPAALEERARNRLEETQQLIPQLFEIASKKRAADDIRVYKGINGVQHFFLEAMRGQPKKSEALVLGMNSQRFFEILPQDSSAYRSMEKIRTERAITWKLLLFGDKVTEAALNLSRPHIELRLLRDAIKSPHDIMVWHDRVSLLFYGDEPYILDLSGDQTVEGFRQYFQVLWKQCTPVRK